MKEAVPWRISRDPPKEVEDVPVAKMTVPPWTTVPPDRPAMLPLSVSEFAEPAWVIPAEPVIGAVTVILPPVV